MDGHGEHMGEIRNAYNILVNKHKGYLIDLDVDHKIILKLIFEERGYEDSEWI
jgi:hypothetical protein